MGECRPARTDWGRHAREAAGPGSGERGVGGMGRTPSPVLHRQGGHQAQGAGGLGAQPRRRLRGRRRGHPRRGAPAAAEPDGPARRLGRPRHRRARARREAVRARRRRMGRARRGRPGRADAVRSALPRPVGPGQDRRAGGVGSRDGDGHRPDRDRRQRHLDGRDRRVEPSRPRRQPVPAGHRLRGRRDPARPQRPWHPRRGDRGRRRQQRRGHQRDELGLAGLHLPHARRHGATAAARTSRRRWRRSSTTPSPTP